MKLKLTWVPNALSLGNLTFGFVSILISAQTFGGIKYNHSLFLLAGFFILIAAIFDGFDGMVARALNATSDLGAELDTLADLTTFGIAPGVLIYKMILEDYKADILGNNVFFPYGMMIAAIFPICAAYRLARFTVAHDPTSFTGLPSPIAGVLVGLYPIAFGQMNVHPIFQITLFVIVALLMVSTIKYSKPQVAMRNKFSKGKLIVLGIGLLSMLILAAIHSKMPIVVYGFLVLYVFSGLISFVIHLIQEL